MLNTHQKQRLKCIYTVSGWFCGGVPRSGEESDHGVHSSEQPQLRRDWPTVQPRLCQEREGIQHKHMHVHYVGTNKTLFWHALFLSRGLTWLWLELKPCWLWWETPECWTKTLPGPGTCHMAAPGFLVTYSITTKKLKLTFAVIQILACRFIQYCRDEEGYIGFVQAEEEEDVVARLSALYIDIEVQGDRPLSLFSLVSPFKMNFELLKWSTLLSFCEFFLSSGDCRECRSAAPGPRVEARHVRERRAQISILSTLKRFISVSLAFSQMCFLTRCL